MSKKSFENSGDHVAPNVHCIADEFPDTHKSCKSSDALAIYEHSDDKGGFYYDAYCWSCEQKFSKEQVHSSSHAEYLGVDPIKKEAVTKKVVKTKPKKSPITKEQLSKIFKHYTFKSYNYRGIKDQYYKDYGHLFLLTDQDKVKATFYPEHLENTLKLKIVFNMFANIKKLPLKGN